MSREVEIIETSWEWDVVPHEEPADELDEMGVAKGVDMLGAYVAGIAVALAVAGLALGAFMRAFVE